MDWTLIISRAVEAGIGSEAIIYALAAIGLNVQFGYTGLLNFGQAGFLAIGAYAIAVTVATFGLPLLPGCRRSACCRPSCWPCCWASSTLRLPGRLPGHRHHRGGGDRPPRRAVGRAVGHLRRHRRPPGLLGARLLRHEPLPPGEYGIPPIIGFDNRSMWVLTVGWVLVAVASFILFMAMKSPWGRVLKAIREDEDAVRSLGKNVFSYKMQALVIGGVSSARWAGSSSP